MNRLPGAGRKTVQPEISAALFQWFVDIRMCFKGRISLTLFRAKCKELHEAAIRSKRSQGKEPTEEELNMKFGKCWIRKWMKDHRVSLRKPNKRYKEALES